MLDTGNSTDVKLQSGRLTRLDDCGCAEDVLKATPLQEVWIPDTSATGLRSPMTSLWWMDYEHTSWPFGLLSTCCLPVSRIQSKGKQAAARRDRGYSEREELPVLDVADHSHSTGTARRLDLDKPYLTHSSLADTADHVWGLAPWQCSTIVVLGATPGPLSDVCKVVEPHVSPIFAKCGL